MPSITEQGTIDLIARIFCDPLLGNRCQETTLVKAGYSKSYARGGRKGKVYADERVIKAIKAIDDKVQAKYNFNKDIALTQLITDRNYLDKAAEAGNIAAINARTAINRELADVTGLHKADAATQAMQINITLPDSTQQEAGEDVNSNKG